jgi:C1A family cysteine protease
MTRRYGWRPDTPDQRDLRFPLRVSAASLPQSVDLRAGCSPVADQGQLGSCTGHAIAGALEYNWLRNHSAPRAASRLFIYYQERVIEHTVPLDAGAMIRDGIKACAKVGVCSEKNWPYRPERFAKKPGARAYADAAQHRVKLYRRVSGLLDFKIALALNHPVVFGFSVYESFESDHVATTGVMSCRSTPSRCSAATRCARSVTTTRCSARSCATAGAPTGATRATSTCPTATSRTAACPTTTG